MQSWIKRTLECSKTNILKTKKLRDVNCKLKLTNIERNENIYLRKLSSLLNGIRMKRQITTLH
jgi:hypothetical protein